MFKGIALKIWLPFLSVPVLISIFVLIYFPKTQRQIIAQQKESELSELAKNVALSVEYSIKDEDFSTLRKSMEYIKSASDISYIALYSTEPGKPAVLFEVFPNNAKSILDNEKDYITSKSNFKTDAINGFIKVAQDKKEIEVIVEKVVGPIYLILSVGILITILFSFYIAKRVAAPLEKLTLSTKKMESGDFTDSVEMIDSNDEIGFLSIGMERLRSSLLIAKKQNEDLTQGLESQVKEKTKELQVILSQLQEAQKIANFGSYVFDIRKNTWESSTEFDNLFGIDTSYNRSFEGFVSLIDEAYRVKLNEAFQKTILTGSDMYLEYEIKRFNDGTKKFVSGFGKLEYDALGDPIKIFGVIQDISLRKSNEEELRRLSMVAKNTSNGVVITDENYNIVWVNEGLSKISGYSLQELIGKKPSIFQFEQTNLDTKKKIKDALLEKKSIQAEILNRGKYGQLYWLDIYIEPLFDDDGIHKGFIAIEIDITERKKNLELQENYILKIEESEKQIRLINENLEKQVLEKTKSVQNLASFPEENPFPVFEFFRNEKKLNYANPAGKQLIGKLEIQIDELWTKFDLDFFNNDNTKEFLFFEKIYEAKLFASEVNNTSRLYFYDITERKQSEEKLKEYVNRLIQTEEMLREKTSDLESAIHNLQFSQSELINKEKLASLGILVAGIAHEVNTPLGAIQASSNNLHKLFNEELMQVMKDVDHLDFLKAISIFQDVDLKFELSFSEERTRVKELNKWLTVNYKGDESIHKLSRNIVSLNLDNQIEKLKQILSEKNHINQLNLALIFLRTFRSIKIIEDASLKGSSLIKALNSYAHGSESEAKELVKIKENVDNCILILWNKIKKGAKVTNSVPEDLVIFGSGSEFSQIWTNLINNALQASDNKCNITIDYKAQNNQHCLSFSNDGPKIPDEIIHKIFDPFFTTKLRGEGTGLGLNIIKNITEKMGGTINCESSEQKTTFNVYFPVINPINF